MENNIAYLTAKVGPQGEVYKKPRVLYVPQNEIKRVIPKTKADPQYPGVKTGVKLDSVGGTTIKVYESSAQIEVARNPATSNIKAQDAVLGASATGTAQGDGLDVTKYLTEVDTATDTSAEAVDLPAATVGAVHVVINNSGVELEIYPASGEDIDDVVDAQHDLPDGKRVHFVCVVAGKWVVAEDKGQ